MLDRPSCPIYKHPIKPIPIARSCLFPIIPTDPTILRTPRYSSANGSRLAAPSRWVSVLCTPWDTVHGHGKYSLHRRIHVQHVLRTPYLYLHVHWRYITVLVHVLRSRSVVLSSLSRSLSLSPSCWPPSPSVALSNKFNFPPTSRSLPLPSYHRPGSKNVIVRDLPPSSFPSINFGSFAAFPCPFHAPPPLPFYIHPPRTSCKSLSSLPLSQAQNSFAVHYLSPIHASHRHSSFPLFCNNLLIFSVVKPLFDDTSHKDSDDTPSTHKHAQARTHTHTHTQTPKHTHDAIHLDDTNRHSRGQPSTTTPRLFSVLALSRCRSQPFCREPLSLSPRISSPLSSSSRCWQSMATASNIDFRRNISRLVTSLSP